MSATQRLQHREMLLGLELLAAVNAIAGAVYGLSGASGVPERWLSGTPFASYVAPSLILLVAVGGGMLLAAALQVTRARRAPEASIAAGAILAGWIVAQVLVVPFSPLQPIAFGVGAAICRLGWRQRRDAGGASLRALSGRAAIALTTGIAATAGGIVGLMAPRGPTTATQAIVVMVLGGAVGAAGGWLLRSRWAMLLAPAAYAIAFEAIGGAPGPSAGGITLAGTWGVLALLLGRGVHGVLAFGPMAVAAAIAAGRARGKPRARGRTARVGFAGRRTITVLFAAGLVLLAVQIVRPASTPSIVDGHGHPVAGSIAELDEVTIGGVEQWIQVRAWSPDKPVLLYIPGGPGQSDLAISRALLTDLTRDFVVVTWDGRGIGKAYPSFDAKALTTDRVVDDTIALTNYLRRRFDERRIYLFGESGGSVIGVLAVQRHPELYHAWLGSGQMVDLRETDRRIYRDLVAYAQRTQDDALLRKLRGYGEPPYRTPWANAFVMGYYDKLAGDYDPPAAYTRRGEDAHVGLFGIGGSEYALMDKVNALRGLMDTFFVLYPQWQQIDFRRSARTLSVPVYLFSGSHELAGRRDLTREWFRELSAPRKRIWSWADAGHATAFEHFGDFRRILTKIVVPETYDRP